MVKIIDPLEQTTEGLFAGVQEYPDDYSRARYEGLIGLDDIKQRLVRQASCLVAPELLHEWAIKHHGEWFSALDAFLARPPMFIFAGDIGTGKTALAESCGDAISRQIGSPVTSFRLSLTTRGSGAVGEMTQLLAAAFSEVVTTARTLVSRDGKRRGAVVLIIDEADALAQSRELAQMHHEDRAGVNELIRGIDDLARADLPVVVLLCTNRVRALDPAISRRAADTFMFTRPDRQQRALLLSELFSAIGFSERDIDALADATGRRDGDVGFTFSDITHRLTQAILMDAFPDCALTPSRAVAIASTMRATAPFEEAFQLTSDDESGH